MPIEYQVMNTYLDKLIETNAINSEEAEQIRTEMLKHYPMKKSTDNSSNELVA